jgi:DNA invertase Pin-like site-specific DNA recombinase
MKEVITIKKIAIYSRKSRETETGDSIENQIILCKEYCNRNYLGEEIEYIIYEDEGFSGKNTDRPRFQELMKDIKSKKINMLICYRLDRISRSVAVFSLH